MHVRHSPFETVHDLAYDLLAKPMTIDELVEELGPAVPSTDPHGLLDWLLSEDPRLLWMRGDLFWRLDAIYQGITFTHRLTEAELERGAFVDDSDWSSLVRQFETVRVGHDELPISISYDDDEKQVLVEGLGPELAACSPSELCGLASSGSGLEFIPVIDEPQPSAELIGAFRAAFERASKGIAGPIEIMDVVRDGLANDREPWLGVLPPVEELVVAAGYQARRSEVASVSFDWDEWMAAAPVRAASFRFHLGAKLQKDLVALVDDYNRWGEGDHDLAVPVGPKPPAVRLSEPEVAEAFVAVLHEYGEETIDDLARFAEQAADAVDLEYRPGCRWIQSLGAEAAADFVAQERLLRQVLSIDPEYDEAETALGWLLFDQSNFVDAFRHLDAAGSESELLDLLAEITAPARSGAGRNDPCPCGSGRKFKRCHGGSTPPFSDRLAVLYLKVARSIEEIRGIPEWWTWPRHWSGDGDGWRAGLHRLDNLGVMTDLLLAEGGRMGDFIERRGSLLPADEVEILQRWVETPRKVWRVTKTDPDLDRIELEALDAVAATGGLLIELGLDGSTSRGALVEGDLVIARPLEVDDGGHRLGGAMIPIGQDRVADALAILAEPDRSPSEIAHDLIELAGLSEDLAESQVVCLARFHSPGGDLDNWLADQATTSPAIIDDDYSDGADELVAELPATDVVIVYDDHFGVRSGGELVLISMNEEAHSQVRKRVADDLPSATLVSEQGVVLAALREEADVRHGQAFSDDWSGPEGYSSREEAFISTLLNEAIALLRSPV